MFIQRDRCIKLVCITIVVVCLSCVTDCDSNLKLTTQFCLPISDTIKARHKTCFLRPDTGPCRADIIQWYFDAKMGKCYRFFWGGCQGNGNKFETQNECLQHCWLNETTAKNYQPRFCSLTYSYGSCFGHYERWYYDTSYKACKRGLYSGCGGNQNNFETLDECWKTCIAYPNHTFGANPHQTTCITIDVPFVKRKKRALSVTLPYRIRRSHKKQLIMRQRK